MSPDRKQHIHIVFGWKVEINLRTRKNIKQYNNSGGDFDKHGCSFNGPGHGSHTGSQLKDLPSTSITNKASPPRAAQSPLTRKDRVPSCANCSLQGSENCNHCFVCGDPGHLVVGCVKRARPQGNGSRSLLRDNQRPLHRSSPTQ